MVSYEINIEVTQSGQSGFFKETEKVKSRIESSYNAKHLKEIIQKRIEEVVRDIEKQIKR